ncbi:MAG: fused MFS/spermidine synthase [Candidatus Parcubacteria bacterium]|nr:fused MFS/spermidine synthase [Burkholderiales bacterium]
MAYAATIFLSSFLLFLVQPLIARQILPWFGGTAAVWTTCMLFFQTVLLAGYAYAHATNAKLSPRAQAILHTVLLAVALALLPIAPAEMWKPGGAEEPISWILLVLTATVGLQYLLLASTSPLLQAWFSRARPSADPYRLFAVSNLASLLALVGYPLLVEPFLGSREQVLGWSGLFVLFALVCAALSWSVSSIRPGESRVQAEGAAGPGRGDYVLWLALSATGSVILLAITNHVTQNVAAIPLLWLAPLTIYLLTFILAFEGGILGFNLYRVEIFWSVVLVWLAGMSWLLVDTKYQFDLRMQIGMYLSGLFVACMFCHGELYRSRPAARHLTAFYLTISAGGAIGGLLVAVVAPLAFNANYELGLSLVALALLAAVRFANVNPVARWASLAMLLAVAACAAYEGSRFQKDVQVSVRNFYGVVRVKEYGTPGEAYHLRRLVHGVIMHGEQDMSDAGRRKPTTYYQPSSGIGAALAAKQAGGAMRVGVIGLGTGTLAAYGRKGDALRFYDINPQVIAIARSQFTFLSDSEAGIELVLGDARLNLERESPQGFDVLAVDAFSSDSIPIHLITKEALGAYLRHMKPDGIVAFHVSNRFLSLAPVVGRLARENGVHAVLVSDKGKEGDDDHTTTDWVLVSRDRKSLQAPEIRAASPEAPDEQPGWRTWTDDYSNLVQILR